MSLLRAECLTCMGDRYPKRYPKDAEERKILDYVRRTLGVLANATDDMAGPVLVRDINDIHEEIFGDRFVYTEVKRKFNHLIMKEEDTCWDRILTASDPLLLAIQYAVTGNLIDFGIFSDVKEEDVSAAIEKAPFLAIDDKEFASLKQELSKAKTLLYLTDNCGEVVMDKLLIRLLKRLYPHLSITVMVRGAEVLNDATMVDAKEIGLTEEVKVITNGNNVAGTWIPELSDEAKEALAGADLILSKGQANLETLRATDLKIYFLFLCKCQMLADVYKVPRLSARLIRNPLAL